MAFKLPWSNRSGTKPAASLAAYVPAAAKRFLSFFQTYPSGEAVVAENALTIPEILTAVRVLSEEIATLPVCLKQDEAKGGEESVDDLLADIVGCNPNPEMTAYELRYWMVADSILRGTGYAQIIRNGKGEVLQLWPLYAQNIAPCRSPEDGSLWWTYGGQYVPDTDILRVQLLPYGSLIGASVIELQSGALGNFKSANDIAGEYFKNSGMIGMSLEVPADYSPDAYERMKQGMREYTEKGRRGSIPILEGGAKLVPISLNAVESQMLESRKYNRTQIAGIFRIPPHMLGDLEHATFSNIEQQDIGFYRHSLRPLLTAWEQRMNKSLLTAEQRQVGLKFEFDLEDLLKGDAKTQAEVSSLLIGCGAKSVDEVRKSYGLGKVDGGNQNLVQGALRPITQPYQSSSGQPASV